jgi:hypothetical protein
MARTQQQDANTPHGVSPLTGGVIIRGVVLAIFCAISYWLIMRILAKTYSISRDDDLAIIVVVSGVTLPKRPVSRCFFIA